MKGVRFRFSGRGSGRRIFDSLANSAHDEAVHGTLLPLGEPFDLLVQIRLHANSKLGIVSHQRLLEPPWFYSHKPPWCIEVNTTVVHAAKKRLAWLEMIRS